MIQLLESAHTLYVLELVVAEVECAQFCVFLDTMDVLQEVVVQFKLF